MSVEDVELWLSTVERLANSSDLGKDLLSVQSLIKKHKALVSDIAEHKGAVEKLVTQAADFAAAGHFDAATISQRCSTISDRYELMCIPLVDNFPLICSNVDTLPCQLWLRTGHTTSRNLRNYTNYYAMLMTRNRGFAKNSVWHRQQTSAVTSHPSR